jgi:hypothetical protein
VKTWTDDVLLLQTRRHRRAAVHQRKGWPRNCSAIVVRVLVQHVAGKRRSGQLWADGWCLLDIGAGIGKGLKVYLSIASPRRLIRLIASLPLAVTSTSSRLIGKVVKP